MSSQNPNVVLSLQDVAKYHAAINMLPLALETIRGMNMGSTSQWKSSQAGLMISTTVVLHHQGTLLSSEYYKFFLTSKIQQNCLENLFSVVRLRRPVPNAYDMKCALKLVCVSQFSHAPTTTSYDVDDSQYLVDILSRGMRECAEAEVAEIDDAKIIFIDESTSTECSILFHLGGFLVKITSKTIDKCERSKAAVLGSSSNAYACLTRLKEYVRDGIHLHYPSDVAMSILKFCEEHFKGIISCTEKLVAPKSPLQAVTAC